MKFTYPLYLVTDDISDNSTMARILKQGLEGGVSIVQMRSKNLSTRELIERANVAKSVIDSFNSTLNNKEQSIVFLINDRVDVALAVDADGVHVGQSDMPVTIARQLLGRNKMIGLTVETYEQLQQSQDLPVDYLGVGTIFATQSKENTQHQWGTEELQLAVNESRLPLVAIGGIQMNNIASVAKTGVESIAVISAIFSAESPTQACQQLLEKIQTAR